MRPPTKRKRSTEEDIDFKSIKNRFFKLNRERLRRIKTDLRPSQRDFLQLLPLLFHVNHPILPGYAAKDTPAGIPEYTPDKPTLNAARRVSKSFELKKRAYRKFDVQALYLMGSTGTIAYSEKSDFDVWVCHDSTLNHDQINALQGKAHGIEQWAASIDVEVNIFLVDAERFKQGEHGALTGENSGSTQHYLLLEEFYRTSVLLAGSYPLWWVVPPEKEANYDEYVDEIKHKRYIHSKDHIDLGGLTNISAEEFYGASLWLLYKGINSPYKSILKILLMEVYASEYPDIELLGTRFKQAVYNDEKITVEKIDPYLMMLHKVEEYLIKKKEFDRLDLVRRSFYFKINEPLSYSSHDKIENWRRDLLSEEVTKWNWSLNHILRLDLRNEWKINSVLEERKALIKEFTRTYRFLSEFSRNHPTPDSLINPEDINILGRKLYAAFDRKAGKIDIIYKGITQDLLESHLSFHRLISEEGHEYWMVFSGIVSEKDIRVTLPLRRAYSIMELLTWCYFNKLFNAHTVIALYAQDSDLTEKELHLIIDSMHRLFPDSVLDDRSTYDLRQPARITAIGTFINVGMDPFSDYTRRGKYLTSSRTDALKYGGRLENLALSIDQLIVTSWQEVLTFRYFGVNGLMKCLQDYFKWSPPSSGKRPPLNKAFSFSSYRGTSIARRIETLFNDIIHCFYESAYAARAGYILGIEWDYYVLRTENDALQFDHPGKIDDLLKYLAQEQNQFSQIVFDAETLKESVLPVIYEKNKPGIIQCFYEVNGEEVSIYVIDEKGSLIQQSKLFYDEIGMVKHYQEFFESTYDRMTFLGYEFKGVEGDFNHVEYYCIDRQANGHRSINHHTVNQYFRPASFIRLQVIVSKVDDKLVFTLFCEDREFSTLEFGANLYKEVAQYILRLRKGGENYPIYVTDIDLAPSLIKGGVQSIQTIHYLNYKKRIEERLLQELARL